MDSVFLKAALAVDSDPWFLMRLKVACEMAGVDYTRHLGVAVASACAEWISVTHEMTVDTTGVTDEQISVAVAAYEPPAPEPAVTPETERRLSTLEARLEQVDTLSEDMSDLRSALTTQATKIGANQPTPSVTEQIVALTARVDTLETLEN